jgi:hypothetical protein
MTSMGLSVRSLKPTQSRDGFTFCCSSWKKNIFVIVLTKEKTVAQALLDCNGGAQVLPLPGCCTGSSQSPEWKDTTWTVNELVDLVLDNHPSKYSNEEARQLVHAGMTPPDAVKVVNAGEDRGRDLLYSPRRK